jgi:tRNA 2-selenouridine synthase SelU
LNIGNGAVELHLYTQDTPIKVAKALIYFIKKIRESDIQVVYGSEEPTQTLQLLKNLDVVVEPSDNPKYKWMARV